MGQRLETRVPASQRGIEAAGAALERFSLEHRLAATAVWPFHLALDEVLSNTVRCGYGDTPEGHEIALAFDLGADVLEVTVTDDGAPFDPLGAKDPDTDRSLEERPVGGLGIFLVKRLMDEVRYERRGASNVLTLRRRVDA